MQSQQLHSLGLHMGVQGQVWLLWFLSNVHAVSLATEKVVKGPTPQECNQLKIWKRPHSFEWHSSTITKSVPSSSRHDIMYM